MLLAGDKNLADSVVLRHLFSVYGCRSECEQAVDGGSSYAVREIEVGRAGIAHREDVRKAPGGARGGAPLDAVGQALYDQTSDGG